MKSNLKDLIAAMNIKATDNPNWCPDVRAQFLEEHGWTREEWDEILWRTPKDDNTGDIPDEVIYKD